MNNRTKALKYNAMSTLVLEVVTFISGLIMPRLILSYFGSTSNGLVGSITQFLGFSVILRAGMGGAIRAALYKPLAENDSKGIDSIMAATRSHMNKISAIIALAIVAFALIYPTLVIDEYSWFYAFTMVLVIGSGTLVDNLFGIKCQILLQADQKYYIATIATILSHIFVTIVSAIIIISGGNMHMVKVGAIIAAFVRPLFLNLYVKKHYTINWKEKPNENAISQRWNAFFQQMAVVVNQNIPLTLLTIFAPLSSVSVYTVHSMVVSNIRAIVNSFTAGINSTFGSMIASKEYENLKKTMFFTEWLVFAIGTLLYSVTAVMLTPFISLYTAGITDVNYYQPAFGILMVACVFIESTRVPYQMLTEGAGIFKETRNGAILEVIVNIAVSVVAVMKLGHIGVLVGRLCAGLIRTFEYSVYSFRHIIKHSILHVVKHYFIIVATVFCCFIVGKFVMFFENSSYINWIFNAILVTLSTGVIVATVSLLFYKNECNVLIGNIKRKYLKK